MRYGLIPYIKQITFRLEKANAYGNLLFSCVVRDGVSQVA